VEIVQSMLSVPSNQVLRIIFPETLTSSHGVRVWEGGICSSMRNP